MNNDPSDHLTTTTWATAKSNLSAGGSAAANPTSSELGGIDSSRQYLSATPPWAAAGTTSILSTAEPSTPDPEDPVWTSIVQALPPQWKYVNWGARHYVDGVTIPFVLIDKPYKYRVFSGRSDLGIRETYELNADGSQSINFLVYNKGYGIIDSTHIKVFVVDPDGNEALVAYWNPRDKPLANVESEYARQARAGGVHWMTNDSLVFSVSLRHVLNNKEYMLRVLHNGLDLGIRPASHLTADRTLTIDLTKYNDGQGIPVQSLIKVLVVDPDVGGVGTIVAGWWQPPGVEPNSLFRPLVPRVKNDSRSSLGAVTALSTPNRSITSSPVVTPTSYTSPPLASLTHIPNSESPSSLSASVAPDSASAVPPPRKKHFWSRRKYD